MKQYIKTPNLETQLHEPDSWGHSQEMLMLMLEAAKGIEAPGKWGTFYNVFNSRLVWLGVGESDDYDYEIPILGADTLYGFRQLYPEKLWDLMSDAQKEVTGKYGHYPYVLISTNHHHIDPFRNGDAPEFQHMFIDRVLKKMIPETDWTSYELRTMPYKEFLGTEYWFHVKLSLMEMFQSRCALCNKKTDLQPHHRTYERRGHELIGDLIPLCRYCHESFHAHRTLSTE